MTRTATESTFSKCPKWERNWIAKGKGFDIPTVCRVFDNRKLVEVEPAPDLPFPQTAPLVPVEARMHTIKPKEGECNGK